MSGPSKPSTSKPSKKDKQRNVNLPSHETSKHESSASHHSRNVERTLNTKKSEGSSKKITKVKSPKRTNSRKKNGAEELKKRTSKDLVHRFSAANVRTTSSGSVKTSSGGNMKTNKQDLSKKPLQNLLSLKDGSKSKTIMYWRLSDSLSASPSSSHYFSSDSVSSTKSQSSAPPRSRSLNVQVTSHPSITQPCSHETKLPQIKSLKSQDGSASASAAKNFSEKLALSRMAGSKGSINDEDVKRKGNSGCELSSRIHGSIFHPLTEYVELYEIVHLLRPIEDLRLEFDMVIPDKTLEYGVAESKRLPDVFNGPAPLDDNQSMNDTSSDLKTCLMCTPWGMCDQTYDLISMYTTNESIDGDISSVMQSSGQDSETPAISNNGVINGYLLQTMAENASGAVEVSAKSDLMSY